MINDSSGLGLDHVSQKTRNVANCEEEIRLLVEEEELMKKEVGSDWERLFNMDEDMLNNVDKQLRINKFMAKLDIRKSI